MADRTSFADFTRLAPGDPLSADNYGLQNRNPTLLDYLMRLLFTGRHDGHAALADPTLDSTATLDDTGGSIPSDLTITVGYTLIDADGGETALSPPLNVTTRAGLVAPDASPTLTPDTAAGTLLAGSYDYAVTLTDGLGGETDLSPVASVLIGPGSATNEINVTGLSTLAAAADGWRLWRSIDGEDWHLIGTGPAATDAFMDDGSHPADCGVNPPLSTGVTNATSVLHVTVPSGQPAEAVQFNIYATTTGDFTQPSLLGTYAIADAGTAKDYTTLTFLPNTPPETSTAMAGLPKISNAELVSGGGGGGGGGLYSYPQDWDTGSLDASTGGTANHIECSAVTGTRSDSTTRVLLYDGGGENAGSEWAWDTSVHSLPSSESTPSWPETVHFFDADAPGMREGSVVVKFQLSVLDADVNATAYALIGHQYGSRAYAALGVSPDGSGSLVTGYQNANDGADDSAGYTAMAAGTVTAATDYWLRVTRQGGQLAGDLFTEDPVVNPAAVAVVSSALTDATHDYDADFRINAMPGFGWNVIDASARSGVIAFTGLTSHASSGGEGYKPMVELARMLIEDSGSTYGYGPTTRLNFVNFNVTDERPDKERITVALPGLAGKTLNTFNFALALNPTYSDMDETNMVLFSSGGSYAGVQASAAGADGLMTSHAGGGLFDTGAQYTRIMLDGVAADDKYGVIVRSIDASNYLLARVDNTTAAPKLQLISVDAGVETVLKSLDITQLLAGTSTWPWDVADPLWLECEYEPGGGFGAAVSIMDPALTIARPEYHTGIRLTGATKTKYDAISGGYGLRLQPAAGGGNTMRVGELFLKGS